MFGRRGQAAMEYLMTYGWAILVVMVVGIAMWRLGIFNMGTGPMSASGFSKIKPQLAASGIRADGTTTLVFTNGVGTQIWIGGPGTDGKGMNVTYPGGGSRVSANCAAVSPNVAADCGAYQGCAASGSQAGCGPIATGDNFMITYNGIAGAAGSSYQVDVSIPYRVAIGSTVNAHTDSGTIRGSYE